MTKEQVQSLYDEYLRRQEIFQTESANNLMFKQGMDQSAINGTAPYNGVMNDHAWWQTMYNMSTNALPVKEDLMNQSFDSYREAKESYERAEQTQWEKDNPELTADIKKQSIKSNYASKNARYLIIGATIILIIGTVFYFIRKRKKASA